jgi:hypothetical protein
MGLKPYFELIILIFHHHFKINHNLQDFTMFQILVYDSKEIGVVLKIFCHGEKQLFLQFQKE